MVTKELCNWFVIASPPSTIYTVDIYTVDIYTVISTVLARPGCSSVDDGWWSYPATPRRPPQPIIDSLVVESTAWAWARPGHNNLASTVGTRTPAQHCPAAAACDLRWKFHRRGNEMCAVLIYRGPLAGLGWAGLGWAGVGAEHF